MCFPASATADSAVVDIFNVTANTWSTAVLSIARQYLAATSLPDHGIAFVAGGYSAFFVIWIMIFLESVNGFGRNALATSHVPATLTRFVFLPAIPSPYFSKTVDIFNVIANTWSKASLSFGRLNLQATSLPSHGIAIFAGGNGIFPNSKYALQIAA
jgi:hypothetical protein